VTLSVVIPARDEAGSIEATLSSLISTLRRQNIPFEIVVVNDGSTDDTSARVEAFFVDGVKLVHNLGRHGFGIAVRVGLELATGDAVAIMMADGSDSPEDLVRYYAEIQKGFDCVFGWESDRISLAQIDRKSTGELVHYAGLRRALQRCHECV
jgi:dolichol-phosphate mannosyltransferase